MNSTGFQSREPLRSFLNASADASPRGGISVKTAEGSILDRSIWLSAPPRTVFPFFADAANLEILTPPWLHFEILSALPIRMQASALIDYRLKLRGVPFKWRSEITAWEPTRRFVDEQRKGPYRFWIHEHLFEEKDGGTLMRDRVLYAVPGGSLVDRLFVRPELDRIFDYRQGQMLRRFGPTEKPAAEAGFTVQGRSATERR